MSISKKIKAGSALIEAGKFREAEALFTSIEKLTYINKLDSAAVTRALAIVYLNTGRIDECINCARRAQELDPNNVYSKFIEMAAHSNISQYQEAYKLAVHLNGAKIPRSALHAFCQATIKQGDFRKFSELGDIYDLLQNIKPADLPNYLGINGVRNRVFDTESLARYLALQLKWGSHMMAEAEASPLTNGVREQATRNRNTDDRVRIGFYALSDIFDTQTILRPILKHLDRIVFDVRLAFIENGPGVVTDESFTNLFEEVIVVPRGSNRDAAIKIAEMGCDIIVDLNGLQQPATRVGAMAWRLAPLQLSWTGRPITCGLPALDYNIVDAVLAGDGSGTLNDTLNLPGAFACFGRMPDFQISSGLPSDRRGRVTFGINAEPAKFNLNTIDMWTAAIKATEGSRVAFMRPEYSSHYLRKNILKEFIARGVTEDRIDFWSKPSKNREHMTLYNEVDILLDCYPMTGGIGMLEAIHMGVPAVSLEGPAIQLRVGASHLHAVGLDDLRAKTIYEYVEKAAVLATDTERRQALRRSLRSKLSATAFTDVDRFAAEFNAALKSLIDHPALKDRASQKHMKGAIMSNDQKITIDGKDYALSEMSDAAKEQLQNVQVTDQEIQSLKIQIAIAQTARTAYAQELKTALDGPGDPAPQLQI